MRVCALTSLGSCTGEPRDSGKVMLRASLRPACRSTVRKSYAPSNALFVA